MNGYVKFCDSCKAEMAIKPSALIGAENSLDLEEINLLEERGIEYQCGTQNIFKKTEVTVCA